LEKQKLPGLQCDLIEPHVVRMLLYVSVQLESDVDIGAVEVGLEIFVNVYRHGFSVYGQADVVDLSIHSLQKPCDVVPCIRGKYWTWKICGYPYKAFRVPYVPFTRVFEVALAAPDVARSVEGLVHIEFQGLRCRRIGDVEVQIVNKVTGVRSCSEMFPPQRLRVRSRSAKPELRRSSIHRWTRDVLRHAIRRIWTNSSRARAAVAIFPSRHLVDIGIGTCARRVARRRRRNRDRHLLLIQSALRVPRLEHDVVRARGQTDRSADCV